ncbi:hypothetical protein MGSAQ_001392, partial [marine sediment metagenome]
RADAAKERKKLRMESAHRPSCDLETMNSKFDEVEDIAK